MQEEIISVTVTAIPNVESLKACGLLVARMDSHHPMHEAVRLQEQMRLWLDKQKMPNAAFLMVGPDTKIETLDEGTMNKLGWFRQPPDFNSPELVEVAIRADGQVAWVNVNGKCALRASQIKNLVLIDQRDDSAKDH